MSTQLAKASTWGFAGRALLLLANLGATPFTIRLLGPSAYGLWALLQTILLYSVPAQAGQWAATTKYGAERYAAGDAVGESEIVWTGLSFVLITSGSLALVLALGSHFLLVLLNVRGTLLTAGAWALRAACGTFVFSSLVGVVNTAQQVRLRWKQFTLFDLASNLLGAIGAPLAIFVFGGGVVTAAEVGLIAACLYFLSLSWDAARVQPALLRPRVSRATLRRLASYGWPLAMAGMAGIPLSTGERFFLAANASTTAVAYYAVAMTVATTLEVLPEQICSPLTPALTRLMAEGKKDEHRALYGKSLAGLFLALSPAAIIVALVAKPFLSLWAGPTYGQHGTLLLLVALAGMFANALSWVPSASLLAAGRTKIYAILQGVELPFYLGAAWVLTAKWGALGAAIVWSARFAVDSVAQSVIVHRLDNLPVLPFSARPVRSVMAPVALGVACFAATLIAQGLVARAAIGAALIVIYAAAVWWLVFTPNERRGLVNLLEEVLGSRMRLQGPRPAHARR